MYSVVPCNATGLNPPEKYEPTGQQIIKSRASPGGETPRALCVPTECHTINVDGLRKEALGTHL